MTLNLYLDKWEAWSYNAFLVGSDYWPDKEAAAIYVDALDDLDWQNPIVASAAKRGWPKILGPGGMKMLG